MTEPVDHQRRKFLMLGLGGVACVCARPALALPCAHTSTKELAFHNLHTGERLRTTFWKEGRFVPEAIAKMNTILRDFRTGDVHPISMNLYELLHDLQTRLETDRPFELISGYRSPKTNSLLSNASHGVAKKSMHMQGMATDIRVHGIDLTTLHKAALDMKRGGVGFYPQSNFVHVDVGRIRKWAGS